MGITKMVQTEVDVTEEVASDLQNLADALRGETPSAVSWGRLAESAQLAAEYAEQRSRSRRFADLPRRSDAEREPDERLTP